MRRPSFGGASSVRSAVRAAEEAGVSDFPDYPKGKLGTIITISYSVRNSDLVIIHPREATQLGDLLQESKAIAAELGLPETDFIQWEGRRTVYVDLEFNDYIELNGRRSTFTFDLDRIKQAIGSRADSWPQPIYLLIRAPQSSTAVLSAGHETIRLDSPKFYRWPDWPSQSELIVESEVSVLGIVIGMSVICVMGFAVLSFVLQPWISERAKRKGKASIIERRSPEEVQSEYDKQTIFKRLLAFAPILVIPLVFLLPKQHFATGVEYVMGSPDLFSPVYLFLGVACAYGVSRLSAWLYFRRKPLAIDAASPDDLDEIKDREAEAGILKMVFLPFACVFLLMVVILMVLTNLAPRLSEAQVGTVRVVVRTLPFLPIVAFAGVAWRYKRKVYKRLNPGDELYDETMRIARLADAKVKRVVVKRSATVNAFATPFGTVGVTSNLIRRLEHDEVRSIIAHEIGHVRLGHAKRNLWLMLPLFIVVVGISILLQFLLPKSFSPMILFGQMMLFPLLILLFTGKGRRRAEHEADAFAVRATGSAETVARALVKVHNLNESPHNLRPFDEYLSTHPSLKKRIDVVMTVDPHTS